jgi:hypothetical protein
MIPKQRKMIPLNHRCNLPDATSLQMIDHLGMAPGQFSAIYVDIAA